MTHYENRVEAFKKQFPSIQQVNRVVVDTGVFKAGDNVLSMSDVEDKAVDKAVLVEALQKYLSVIDNNLKIIDVSKKEK